MGCDVHACLERRTTDGWRFYNALELDRNYHLFGILAGVRRDHEPIVPQRGLPPDLDPRSVTRESHHGDSYYETGHDFGDHSFSWLTLTELRGYNWDTRLIDEGCIPLRAVDRRGSFDDFYKEPYADWIQSAPHPPAGWCGGAGGVELLDLRPHEFLLDGLSHTDKRSRDAAARVIAKCQSDMVKASRYLADPKLFPDPEGPPPEGFGVGQGWGALFGEVRRDLAKARGVPRPRTAWAYVAWSLTAREACAKFCMWLDETRDLPGETTRLVFGFDS
jgi:hypothetical protein